MNLSLIIPVRNEEKQIKVTLNKLNSFKKKIKDIEVVFINDFSDDKTEHLIKSFSKKLDKVVLEFHELLSNLVLYHQIF